MHRFLILISLILLLAPSAYSEESAGVYLVDLERVLKESIAGKAAQSNVEIEVKKRGKRLEGLKLEFENSKKAYTKQASVLSEEALYEKRKELAEKEREVARAFKDEQGEIARKNNAEVGKVVKEARKIAAEIAREKGVQFVVEKDKDLYFTQIQILILAIKL